MKAFVPARRSQDPRVSRRKVISLDAMTWHNRFCHIHTPETSDPIFCERCLVFKGRGDGLPLKRWTKDPTVWLEEVFVDFKGPYSWMIKRHFDKPPYACHSGATILFMIVEGSLGWPFCYGLASKDEAGPKAMRHFLRVEGNCGVVRCDNEP